MQSRLRHRIAAILLFLILLPYALAVVYPLMYPPSTRMVYDTLRFKPTKRQWVKLADISPNLIAAVLISEDDMFCGHHGVNVRQMQKSIKQAETRNRPIRATSTLTQQLAKNLFLWHGRSWVRKILEAPLALWLDLIWSKKRILETYLNIVEWGDGIYGAEAAARYYFGISASKLSPSQAARLATTLPNPKKRSASNPGSIQAAHASLVASRIVNDAPDVSCMLGMNILY